MTARVLIVDPDIGRRHRLRGLYEHHGHVVEYAANAVDAIKLGLVLLPHLVMTAWDLDDETSGLRVAEALLKHLPRPRIVFLTNRSPKELQPLCEHLAGYRFLDVNASPATLLALTEGLSGGTPDPDQG